MEDGRADYKSAKEAFVADNLGSSIWSIQLTSLTALSAYVLYSVYSRRKNVLLDYTTMVLPLLLGVTILSDRPYTLNGVLLAFSVFGYVTRPTRSMRKVQGRETQSKGKWLDESDSDEEPSQPVFSSATSTGISTFSPVDRISTQLPSTASTSSDTLSPDRVGKDASEFTKRTFKRRHSPTPSTHTHTAIDVLTTPETNSFKIDNNPAYPPHPKTKQSTAQTNGRTPLPYLTVYRAHMMIMTIHCILAVDFPVFPRYQGKCEDFGSSLMDVGVGSFVFSLGLVSHGAISKQRNGIVKQVFMAIKKASPILFLGIVRVLMVKGTEYPEHVTEYGVHWNFFFTLGLLPILGILLRPLYEVVGWTPLALVVALIHHLALHTFGLQQWVLSPGRIGLIGMNKEGLVSLPGYLAIYALGLGIGQHILRDPLAQSIDTKPHPATSNEEYQRMRMDKKRVDSAMELFGYCLGWWLLLFFFRLNGEEISRRLANLPYVLWTVAYNTTFLLGYLIIEMTFFPSMPPTSSISGERISPVPPLLDAINKNGLLVFLLANLMTGLVNVSMETMYIRDSWAMGVLVLYSVSVCGLAWACRGFRIKI